MWTLKLSIIGPKEKYKLTDKRLTNSCRCEYYTANGCGHPTVFIKNNGVITKHNENLSFFRIII